MDYSVKVGLDYWETRSMEAGRAVSLG